MNFKNNFKYVIHFSNGPLESDERKYITEIGRPSLVDAINKIYETANGRTIKIISICEVIEGKRSLKSIYF